MKYGIWLLLLMTTTSWAQTPINLNGITLTSGVHVYLEEGSEGYIKLSTDTQLANHFKNNTDKVYDAFDFILDYKKQEKELKKIENKIKEGSQYKINEHLDSLNKKGINQFAVIFSIISGKNPKRTITLYDIKGSDSENYQMLARVRLAENQNVDEKIISELFYDGLKTANQGAGMDKKKRELEATIHQLFESLEITEILVNDLKRKAKSIDDYPRARKDVEPQEKEQNLENDIVIKQ